MNSPETWQIGTSLGDLTKMCLATLARHSADHSFFLSCLLGLYTNMSARMRSREVYCMCSNYCTYSTPSHNGQTAPGAMIDSTDWALRTDTTELPFETVRAAITSKGGLVTIL